MDPLTAALAGLSTDVQVTSSNSVSTKHSFRHAAPAGHEQYASTHLGAAAPTPAAPASGPNSITSIGDSSSEDHEHPEPHETLDDPLTHPDADADEDTLSPLSPLSRVASSPIPVPAGSGGLGSVGGSGNSLNRQQEGFASPADPDLDPDVLGQLLQRASPAISDRRFSMEEFLKNKAQLATAARRELGGGCSHSVADDDDVGSCLEGSGHEAELSRQASHLASIVEGVAEESKVNRELAGLLVERLDSSRKALECLLRLLTCLMDAEATYSSAMAAAAKAAAAGPLAAPADSGGLAAAVEGLVQLPAAAAAGHRQLYLELQVLVDSVRGLWRKYNAAAKEVKQSVNTVQRAVDSCCKQLTASFIEHKAACEAFDAVVVWQSTGHASSSSGGGGSSAAAAAALRQQQHRRGLSASSIEAVGDVWTGAAGVAAAALHLAAAAAGSSSGGGVGGVLRPRFAAAPARDPWASEGKLVAEQQALQKWQGQERELLQRGFDTLQSLEGERVCALMQAGGALAASYCSAIEGLPAAAEGLRGMLGGLGGAGEAGVAHLAQVAADMRATSQALAARQAEAVSCVSQELFCSPEIIRQGPMELWQPKSSSWTGGHFVLTRAGFLHWFKSMEEVVPQDAPLNLCRCSFEAGAAPVFHIVEAGSGSWLVGRGSRKITLQASSIEECCEWAIALREAIALSSSTGAAAAGAGGSSSGGIKQQQSRLSR